jgi:alpha-N-acetylglucosaminidase
VFLTWSVWTGYAGPLDPAWRAGQLALGQQIVGRMRDLGMTTVLPGFAGHVPPAMLQLYPKANITQSPTWAGFNSSYSACLRDVKLILPFVERGTCPAHA